MENLRSSTGKVHRGRVWGNGFFTLCGCSFERHFVQPVGDKPVTCKRCIEIIYDEAEKLIDQGLLVACEDGLHWGL